jgi:hypothetical protein
MFDGSDTGSRTAVIDFKGLKWVDQLQILDSITSARGLKFREITQNGRQIVLKFSNTHIETLLSFLRELTSSFGFVPVRVAQ